MKGWSAVLLLALASIACVRVVHAEPAPGPLLLVQSQATLTTQDYAKRAAVGDLFEVDAAQLAQSKARSAHVKAFAADLQRDHVKMLETLRQTIMASPRQVPLPSELDAHHRHLMDELGRKSGEEFDRLYLQVQAKAHQDALQLHEAYAANGEDEKLRGVAAQAARTVKQHMEMLRNLADSIAPSRT